MEDRELLREFALAKSQAAFSELVRRHTDWVYGVCRRRVGDASLAEDATQAVFLALARKARSLTNQSTLSPWLYQAAKFAANNIRRAAMRRARHESRAAAMTPTETSPESSAQWQQLEGRIEPLLDRLKARDRQAILLKFYEQKTGGEIAAMLGISEEAAHKRVSRALERVRALWAQSGGTVPSAQIGALLLSHAVRPAPASLAARLSALTASNLAPHLAPVVKGILFMKAKIAISVVVAAFLIVAIPTTIIVLFLSQTSSPLTPPTQAAATSAGDPNGPMTLTIKATIDGVDVLDITPTGAVWTHKAFDPPEWVAINGRTVGLHTRQTLSQLGLAAADLSSAQVVERSGRGIVALEKTDLGIAIHFSDPQPGAAPYMVRITFAPRSATPNAPPTTLPTTLPSNREIFLDVKATIAGGDVLSITPHGAQWQHKCQNWPSNVTINDQPWNVQAQPTLTNTVLKDANLSSAQVIFHSGRDTAVMEKADQGIAIYFSEGVGVSSDYEIKVRFLRMK